MNKAKDMLNTIIHKPVREIRSRSSQAYERYQELFRSIKKLAKGSKGMGPKRERK